MLENLFNKEESIPKDFSTDNEEEYFQLLKSPDVGKAITNMAEYLLETEGVYGKSKVFIANLSYFRTQHFGSD